MFVFICFQLYLKYHTVKMHSVKLVNLYSKIYSAEFMSFMLKNFEELKICKVHASENFRKIEVGLKIPI